jgi:hypothetical protein
VEAGVPKIKAMKLKKLIEANAKEAAERRAQEEAAVEDDAPAEEPVEEEAAEVEEAVADHAGVDDDVRDDDCEEEEEEDTRPNELSTILDEFGLSAMYGSVKGEAGDVTYDALSQVSVASLTSAGVPSAAAIKLRKLATTRVIEAEEAAEAAAEAAEAAAAAAEADTSDSVSNAPSVAGSDAQIEEAVTDEGSTVEHAHSVVFLCCLEVFPDVFFYINIILLLRWGFAE